MKKPARTYVLQEDQHLQNLRKIIKRDFFSSSNSNQKSDTIQLSLNDYITNFKSNQNQTFSELVESDKEKWKKQHWWFEKQDKLLMIERQKLQKQKLERKEYQNMIKQTDSKFNVLAIANQEAKNSIFFNRDNNFGSYLCQDSVNAKKINYNNCRLKDDKEKQQVEQCVGEGKQSDSENENPITWGQIQSTPLRIKGESQFRIRQRPQKDVLLEKLNEKISKSKIQAQRSTRKSQMMMKILGSSTPSYKNSSYIRNSSIRRAGVPSTPLVQNKQKKQQNSEMQGLLNFKK